MFGPELRALDLTDAQHEQVKAIMESHREEQKAVRGKMMTARKALHDAIAADVIDEAAIRAAAGAVAALDADEAVQQARIHAEVFAILTPEQVKKAKELRTEMENRMKEGRGRGRGMRPHPMPPPEPRAEGDISLPETV
jgi:Spy/CpxP family protein refolding chaperone